MGVSENSGTPKSSILIGVFQYKPPILGYPYFWKHQYIPLDFHPFFCLDFILYGRRWLPFEGHHVAKSSWHLHSRSTKSLALGC